MVTFNLHIFERIFRLELIMQRICQGERFLKCGLLLLIHLNTIGTVQLCHGLLKLPPEVFLGLQLIFQILNLKNAMFRYLRTDPPW